MDTKQDNGYVPFAMHPLDSHIVLANESHLDALEELLRVVEAEDRPEEAMPAVSASEGLRKALRHYNVLNSDCVWVLIAFSGDQPIGLAAATRIPKLDARLGFLYLDELHVTRKYRRHGVGQSLLLRCIELAQELGLAGIRLLARIDNEPARQIYESVGFRGDQSLLYQYGFDPVDPQP